jgi:hypothetical protein
VCPCMIAVQIAADVVKHIQEVHGRALSGLVCEFVQGHDGVVSLTAVMRTEWDPVPVPSRSSSETPYDLSANASYEVRVVRPPRSHGSHGNRWHT